MRLSDFKKALQSINSVQFQTPLGTDVPAHFHITEAGLTTKHFIDCGGTTRKDSVVSMQLWTADDYEHRLTAEKLADILKKASHLFGNEDLDAEIEYQSDTIGRYGVEFESPYFQLVSKQTDCLAKETCGVAPVTLEMETAEIGQSGSVCVPGSGCC